MRNERDLDYVPIIGPAVDAYNGRYDGDGKWAPHEPVALVPVPVTIIAGQSKKWSRYEAAADTLIGFFVGVAGNIIFLPLVASEMGVGIAAAVTLTLAFMMLSYVRKYSVRRYFNWLQFRKA